MFAAVGDQRAHPEVEVCDAHSTSTLDASIILFLFNKRNEL